MKVIESLFTAFTVTMVVVIALGSAGLAAYLVFSIYGPVAAMAAGILTLLFVAVFLTELAG